MISDVPVASTCLFLDVDGSLLDIAPRPHDVHVPKTLVRDLDAVSRVLDGAVALVSGRSISQLDDLFSPIHLRASGVHGAEWRGQPEGVVEGPPAGPIPRAVWEEVETLLTDFPGVLAEDKRFSFAVHYRAVPVLAADLEKALNGILERNAGAHLRLMPGHFVFEIKGAGFDKGVAVRRFLREKPFAGRTPIFIGDDVTDYPGFAAATEAGGSAYAVGNDIPGTSGTFGSPSAVRQWLAALAATETISA